MNKVVVRLVGGSVGEQESVGIVGRQCAGQRGDLRYFDRRRFFLFLSSTNFAQGEHGSPVQFGVGIPLLVSILFADKSVPASASI